MSTEIRTKRILVVDDEEHIRKVLSRALMAQGYDVATAANGEEALLKASESPFDMALLDLKMPGMGGLEALQKLKEKLPGIVVIMLTGVADNESIVTSSMAKGAVAFLTKPCSLADLKETVSKAFGSGSPSTIVECSRGS
ncbi:MAG: response regulator [Chloroflexi bacterium]|nr:response regulator [Chloroflexota bacterium]